MPVDSTDTSSDLDLLKAWEQGDDKAGQRLFMRHYDSIYRFFNSKLDTDVLDLVQSTFEACITAKERFNRESSFRTFLLGIARHKLMEHLRRLRKYRSHDPIDFSSVSLVELGASPSSHLRAQQQAQLVHAALRHIPVDDQIVVELIYWERMTGVQLGEVLGLKENTARSRLRRAKERLAEQLGRLEREPTLLKNTLRDLDNLLQEISAAAAARYPQFAGLGSEPKSNT